MFLESLDSRLRVRQGALDFPIIMLDIGAKIGKRNLDLQDQQQFAEKGWLLRTASFRNPSGISSGIFISGLSESWVG